MTLRVNKEADKLPYHQNDPHDPQAMTQTF